MFIGPLSLLFRKKRKIMMSECNHDCSACGEDCSSRSENTISVLPQNPMSNIKKVIGVVSGKGGVGKSMVTSMLAVLMSRTGCSVGILDADITGPSIPKSFGLKEKMQGDGTFLYPCITKTGIKVASVNMLLKNEDDPVIWRGPVLGGMVTQFWSDVAWDSVDYMFVDMPPGTGDVPLTVFQSLPVDGIVIVSSPQDLVSMIVGKAVNMAGMMNIPIIGMIENYSYYPCPDCGKKLYPFGQSKAEDVSSKYGIPLLAQLPIDPALAACADSGVMELFEGEYLENAVRAIENLK